MKKSQLQQIIKEELLREMNGDVTIDYDVWAFIITDGEGNILTKSGKFEKKPLASKMAIFDDIMSAGRKVKELKNKGITAFGYELSNSWDK
jgi:uncharacterized protein YegL